MKLVRPTDFEILDALRDGKHYTASVIARDLDKETDYVSTRMGHLNGVDLLAVLGRAKQCKPYRITFTGLSALAHHSVYSSKFSGEFGHLSRRIASLQRSSPDLMTLRVEEFPDLSVREWHPNAFLVTEHQYRLLRDIEAAESATLQDLNQSEQSLNTIERLVYQLRYHGLVSEHEFEYSLTDLGAETLKLCQRHSEPESWTEEDSVDVFRALNDGGIITRPDWYEPALFAEKIRNPSLPHAYVATDDDD